jgi:AbrB family looped-hinge helix DNA binding protein
LVGKYKFQVSLKMLISELNMPRRNVGPKGQVVIPKQLRDVLGLKPGVEVILEIRGDEIVISKPKIEGSYTEYYTSTHVSKLKKTINIKKTIEDEVAQRHEVR